VIGVGLRTAFGARAVPLEAEPLVRNVRIGVGFASEAWAPASVTGDRAPLGVVVAAFSPLGDRLASLAAFVAVVVLAAALAIRWRGPAVGALAAFLVALAPPVWDAPLSVTAAAALALGAVVLAWPSVAEPGGSMSRGRVVAVGVCAGLAALARPDAIVLAVLLPLWPAVLGRDAAVVRRVAAVVPVSLLVAAPWLNFVWSTFGVPMLAPSARAMLAEPGSSHRLPGPLVVLVDLAVVGAVLVLGRARRGPLWGDRWRRVLPLVAVPAASIGLGGVVALDRGLLSWTAPLLLVVLAAAVRSWWVAGRRRVPVDRADQMPEGASTTVAL
jgi:hypothetical protein